VFVQKAAKSSKQVGKGKEGRGVVTKYPTSLQQASSRSSSKGGQLDTTSIENLPNYSVALGMIGTIHEVFANAVYCYCCY
jgi:hypothetical protein